jgi:hypothetical protein
VVRARANQGPGGGGGGGGGPGGGEREMGGQQQRGPLGAERDVYRQAENYDYDYPPPQQGGRESGGPWGEGRSQNVNSQGGGGGGPFGGGPFGGGGNGGGGGGGNSRVTNFIIAGAFIVGMGAGVAFDTAVDLEPSNVASREILDRQTPSSELCMANGASAMVFDQRVFMVRAVIVEFSLPLALESRLVSTL